MFSAWRQFWDYIDSNQCRHGIEHEKQKWEIEKSWEIVSILKKVTFSKILNNVNVSFLAKLNSLSQDCLDMAFKQLENILPLQEQNTSKSDLGTFLLKLLMKQSAAKLVEDVYYPENIEKFPNALNCR